MWTRRQTTLTSEAISIRGGDPRWWDFEDLDGRRSNRWLGEVNEAAG